MNTIYVLKLENNKIYVGKSKNPKKRIDDHFDGRGSSWTKLHKPVKLIKTIENADDFEEDKQTKIYMLEYGIENVRGGSYCSVNLTNNQIALLKSELSTSTDACFKCGQSGHFASECNQNKCYACGQFGHISTNCPGSIDINKPICHRFIEGNCKFGSNCKFSHKYTDSYVQKNICNDFQKGNCTRKSCFFIHTKLKLETVSHRHPSENKSNFNSLRRAKKIRFNDLVCLMSDGLVIEKVIPSNTIYIKLFGKIPNRWKKSTLLKKDLADLGILVKYVELIDQEYYLKFSINIDFTSIKSYCAILNNLAFCNKHQIIKCDNISCQLSLQTNKMTASITFDNSINEITLIGPSIHFFDVEQYLLNSGYDIKSLLVCPNNFDISFNLNDQCITDMLYSNTELFNLVSPKLNFCVSVPYYKEKFNNFPYTINEYLVSILGVRCPKINFQNDLIVFESNNLQDKLAAKREIQKIYDDMYLDVDYSLILMFDKYLTPDKRFYASDLLTNIATNNKEINVDINILLSCNKIKISGMPNDKMIAKNNIEIFLSNKQNNLTHLSIDLTNYSTDAIKNIKKHVITDVESINVLRVNITLLKDSVCVKGAYHIVNNAVEVLKATFEFVANKSKSISANLNDDVPICKLCGCETENQILLKTCKCEYCLACYKHMILNTFSTDAICVSCMGCNKPIRLDDLEIFTKVELDKIYSRAFDKYMEINWNNFDRCLTPDCSGIYHKTSQRILHCKICSNVWCLRCEKSYYGKICSHDGLDCESFAKNNSQDIQTINWLNSNTKPCPNCNIRIQKNEGCLHMTCYRCKHHFCWKCLKQWSQNHTNYYSCNRNEANVNVQSIENDNLSIEIDNQPIEIDDQPLINLLNNLISLTQLRNRFSTAN